ncbi:MAG: hypothetical protein Q7R59_01330 [bacterium]|nr:hypothetical protein [bacterium]
MREKMNTYAAVLIIIIASAGAAWFIIRLAIARPSAIMTGTNEASYAPLQDSILNGN